MDIKDTEEYKSTRALLNKITMKQETLEEAAKAFAKTQVVRGKNLPEWDDKVEEIIARNFTEGAKWQKERMYSEEDMKSAFFNGGNMKDIEEFNYWFEQFKKK